MNPINSQTFSEIPTVISGSQSSCIDKDFQISEAALAALNQKPSLKRSLSAASNPASDSLSSKRIKRVPSKEDSDEEIIAYLQLDTWRCEKNREEMVSALISCFRAQKIHLSLPDVGLAQIPNCLEKMHWIRSLQVKSTKHLGNFSILTKLRNLKRLSLEGETTEISFLKWMPFLEELCLSYNPMLENLSFLKNYSNLIELDLHYNRNLKDLSKIKSFAHRPLQKLESLSLSGKFRNLSFLGSLPSLKKLSVSSNPALKRLSFLKHVPDLLELSVTNNPNLIKLSGIEILVRLMKLNLVNTRVKNLLILEDLPKLDYLISRYNTPWIGVKKSPLGLLRMNIKDENLQRIPLRPLIDSDKNISSWLKRLTNGDPDKPMQTWKILQSREAVSRHVLEILACAQKDSVFAKEILLPLVHDSMTSCSDRTLYYLNEIIRQLDLYQTKDVTSCQAIPVFEKYYRLFLVKELARESAETRNILHEEIEVQLNFFQKLDLELPFLQAEYSNLYRAGAQEIEEAASKLSQKLEDPLEWVRYLCLDPFWQQRLFVENPALKVEFDRIEESKYEELEVILANVPNHPAPLKELEIRHQQKIVKTLDRETLGFLEDRAR